MSYEKRIGVFAEVTLKKVEETSAHYGCREHGDVGEINAKFCSQCSKPLELWTETKKVVPSYYHLVNNIDSMEDVFSVVENSDLNLPEGTIILFGNNGRVDTEIDSDFSEITKENIDLLLNNFHNAYDEWLDKLRPFTESIAVKFGVVTEWN